MTPRPRPRTPLVLFSVIAALALGLGLGAAAFAVVDDSTTTVVRQVTVEGSEPVSADSLSASEVYDRTSKAVVEISANGGSQTRAQGSGFVYDTDGHIVTNQHVVASASSISVSFWNGVELDAELVGTDPSTDLAVIRVDAPAGLLSPLRLADSSAVDVGDPVLAMGSPFGLEGTITAGIVSALHREMTAPNNYLDHRHDPDRRSHQPRQLGWPPARPQGTRDRRQRPDRERIRGLGRRRVRDSVQHRPLDNAPTHLDR